MHIRYVMFDKKCTRKSKNNKKYTFIPNVKYRIKRETENRFITIKGIRLAKSEEGKIYTIFEK